MTRDKKIRVHYLPKNITSNIQPLDHRITVAFKKYYRQELVRAIIEKSLDIPTLLKQMNIKDAFDHCQTAWDQVQPITVLTCCNNGLGGDDKPDNTPQPENDTDYTCADFLGFSDEEIMAAQAKLASSIDVHINTIVFKFTFSCCCLYLSST